MASYHDINAEDPCRVGQTISLCRLPDPHNQRLTDKRRSSAPLVVEPLVVIAV